MKKRKKLLINALIKFFGGFLIIGLLLFGGAGSLAFVNGWILIVVLLVPIFCFGAYLFLKDPASLERRLESKESDKIQIFVVMVSAILFIASFLLATWDYRNNFSRLPIPIVWFFVIVMLIGYLMFIVVIRQNTYAARTVRVEEKQELISTGLYAIVRHPMYTATLLIFCSIPLILGSLISLVPMLSYPTLLVIRIKNEEILLKRELPGYIEYCKRVKYRLIPYIW